MRLQEQTGKLDQRVTLVHPNPMAFDDIGGLDPQQSLQITSWASVTPDGVNAGEDQDRLSVRARIVVRLRYGQDIDRNCHVIWRGDTYRTLTMQDPDGQRDWLDLVCERDI